MRSSSSDSSSTPSTGFDLKISHAYGGCSWFRESLGHRLPPRFTTTGANVGALLLIRQRAVIARAVPLRPLAVNQHRANRPGS